MVLGRVAASIGKGLIGSVNARRGKRRKKLTTSQAAIRRFEARKRGGTGRTPTRKPWGPQGGPRRDAKPTGRGPRTSRTTRSAIARSKSRRGSLNTGPKRPTPKRTTSQAAIARFKAMRGRRRR
tara:strand:+ start:79 stop:450 length:372 start_codon:yes stop_codon:yes gene_type:complete